MVPEKVTPAEAAVLFAITRRESVRTTDAEMVLFPVPPPEVVTVAGPLPASSKVSGPPAVPLGIPIVVVPVLLKLIEPTVIPPPAEVPARLAL